jgi:hypothetical protein
MNVQGILPQDRGTPEAHLNNRAGGKNRNFIAI